MIDIHTLILPGLDDGPPDTETALRMCRMAAADGIDTIAATPHTLNGVYEQDKNRILDACAQLNAALPKNAIAVTIVPGEEVHITPDIIERLDKNLLLTYADAGAHLLIEPSFFAPPPRFRETVFAVMLRKITPVIAHVERLPYFCGDYGLMEELRAQGALLQLTSGSIMGRFGDEARDFSLGLISRGLASAVSSDAHGPEKRRPVLSDAFDQVRTRFGADAARLLFVSGPASIIGKGIRE